MTSIVKKPFIELPLPFYAAGLKRSRSSTSGGYAGRGGSEEGAA